MLENLTILKEFAVFLQGLSMTGKVLAILSLWSITLFVTFVVLLDPKVESPPQSPASANASPIPAPTASPEVERSSSKAVDGVDVGPVTSNNQSGGVTAGYVGEVNQNK